MIKVNQSQESLLLSYCMLEIAKNIMVIQSIDKELTESDKIFLDRVIEDIKNI